MFFENFFKNPSSKLSAKFISTLILKIYGKILVNVKACANRDMATFVKF